MLQRILSFFKSKEIAKLRNNVAELYIDLSKKQFELDRLNDKILLINEKKTPPTNNTVLLYTDKSGTNWFGFKTFEYLPNERRVQHLLCTTAIELNLSKDEITKYLDTMNSLLFNIEKDLPANKARLVSLNERIRERLNLSAYYKVIADLINVYFFIEGEDPNKLEESFVNKKNELLKNDLDARNFFFVYLAQKVYGLTDISETDVLEYLLSQLNDKILHLQDLQ